MEVESGLALGGEGSWKERCPKGHELRCIYSEEFYTRVKSFSWKYITARSGAIPLTHGLVIGVFAYAGVIQRSRHSTRAAPGQCTNDAAKKHGAFYLLDDYHQSAHLTFCPASALDADAPDISQSPAGLLTGACRSKSSGQLSRLRLFWPIRGLCGEASPATSWILLWVWYGLLLNCRCMPRKHQQSHGYIWVGFLLICDSLLIRFSY